MKPNLAWISSKRNVWLLEKRNAHLHWFLWRCFPKPKWWQQNWMFISFCLFALMYAVMTSFVGVSHGIVIKKLEDYVHSIQYLKYHSLLIFIHSIDIYVCQHCSQCTDRSIKTTRKISVAFSQSTIYHSSLKSWQLAQWLSHVSTDEPVNMS